MELLLHRYGALLDRHDSAATIELSIGRHILKVSLWFAGECVAGCLLIALQTAIAYQLHFNASTVGFISLLTVVSIAKLCGFWQATVVSIAAVLCLDYFFQPPLFVLTVADPQDWVALGAFEMSALIVSRLSVREQKNARDALMQRKAMAKLYEVSQSTLLMDMQQAPGPQLVRLMLRILNAEAVAIFDPELARSDSAGSWAADESGLARDCYLLDINRDDRPTRTSSRVLKLGGVTIGALVIRGEQTSLMSDALASMTASAFERYRSFEKETLAQAAHHSERLRTAVLDSLAHAFKTPLTAILTASSGMLEMGDLTSPQSRLVSLIDDEATELNELCTRLLLTAKIETEQVAPGADDVVISQLISQVLTDRSVAFRDHAIEVSIPDEKLAVLGDRRLIETILVQYIDNAAKYSSPGSPIGIAAYESRSEVLISVHNEGPAIRLEDRDRIFERFYRCPSTTQKASGTGIGLSIAKKAAEAHHGHVWVISDECEGTTFFLSLPNRLGATG